MEAFKKPSEVSIRLEFNIYILLQMVLGYAHTKACAGDETKLCELIKKLHVAICQNTDEESEVA